jgi:hypothetical protein
VLRFLGTRFLEVGSFVMRSFILPGASALCVLLSASSVAASEAELV